MSFTMPDVAATRAKMLAAYRDGLRDVLEESTRTVAELQSLVEETARDATEGQPASKVEAAVEADLLAITDVPVITKRDVDQALNAIFGQPVPMPDETWAEVHTPATIVTSAVCPRCGMAQRILVNLHAELLIGEDGSELRVKPKTKGVAHICGQLPLPVEEVADGQQELPLDAEAEAEEEVKLLEAGETPDAEAEAEPDVLYALVKDGETLDEALARIEKFDDYARVIGTVAGQALLDAIVERGGDFVPFPVAGAA